MNWQLDPDTRRRNWAIVGAGVVAVAVAGYFTGLRKLPVTAPTPPASAPPGDRHRSVGEALNYQQLQDSRRGPNGHVYASAFDALRRTGSGASPDVSPEGRELALMERLANRAYDGAPPTIPHAVNQKGDAGCLACHQTGVEIAGRTAPRISHPELVSCTQCHASATSARPLSKPGIVVENTFSGLERSGQGSRAWAGAPPTIPHSTQMREACDSCHGPTGKPGLRTTHPERKSCTQCHAPSSVLFHRAFAGQP